ncbi:MAG TPA: translation initiation factor IF-2, partial [Spirochaetia bacterium]|nr:translation initiation factor IF-2 [Spirochaetia bacterium]
MPEDRSKIQLKKAADGTITKTVIKKIVKKVRLKKIEEKPPVKAVPPAAVQPPKTPVKPPIRPAPRPDYRNQGARPQRPGDNTRYPQNRPYDRDAAGKKKIFIARGPAARPGQTAPASPIQDKQKIAEKRKHKLKDRDKDKFSHEDSLEKHLYYHKKDRDEKEIFSNVPTSINIMEKVPIKVFAHKLNVKANEIIKKLMSMGLMVTINDTIDAESASIVAQEFKCEVKVTSLYEQTIVDEDKGSENDYGKRDPIVTVMGHVDHGKTQLLDSIRKTNVIATESGGITQHIGAYKVSIPQGGITFIDTPGHEAFTAMRARGAKITDIVILVVAADDGIMPQTIEALNHAREAKVPVIVAINKIDKPEANIERVKKQLAEHNLLAEDWGGDTIIAPVSALKHQGIDKLLESILLVAEMHEYKGNPKVRAKGTVIESKIEQGKGTVVTVVIQNGTLHIGDPFVCGIYSGKVRAMFDEH